MRSYYHYAQDYNIWCARREKPTGR